MTRDPFEHMKNSNPVPPGMEPSAPMSMADRIVGAGSTAGRWPAWALTAVTAVAVLVVGLASVWMLGDDGGDDVAAGGETTTSSALATTTSVTPTTGYVTTTLAPEYGFDAVVYFLGEGVGDTAQSGPYLIPVAVPTTDRDEVTGTVVALLRGPTPGQLESVPAISSAIPSGTVVRDVTVADGVATVDLSSEYTSGGGSFSMFGRLAQVVFTLTRFDEVDGVRFLVDGAPLTVLGGEGIIVGDPMTREDFYPGIGNSWDAGPDTGFVPAVMIESPAYGGAEGGNPLVADGVANVFEATVSLALTDADGLIIWEGFTTASCGTGCWGEWDVTIPYDVDEPQMGALIAWESSAMDGSQINVREHPVWLTPAGDGATCSGALVTDSLIEQPGLSPQNAAMREQIFEAATSCDWDTLRSLQIEGFQYSFGDNVDAIAFWQGLEAAGEQPIRYLAELLNRPYGTQPGPGGEDYYAWPSAFVTEWSQVPEKEIDELRPLYDDDDFAGFAEFGGYYGYRVGIIDGSWVYFVAGD